MGFDGFGAGHLKLFNVVLVSDPRILEVVQVHVEGNQMS